MVLGLDKAILAGKMRKNNYSVDVGSLQDFSGARWRALSQIGGRIGNSNGNRSVVSAVPSLRLRQSGVPLCGECLARLTPCFKQGRSKAEQDFVQ